MIRWPRFSYRVGAASLGLLGWIAFCYIRRVTPYRPRLERLALTIPPGHEGLQGLRIGFITDTHIGPFVQPDHLAKAAALLAKARPDLVLLGGDYVSESPRYAIPMAAAMREIVRDASLGAFAVLGNHDVANDAARISAALESVGIVVLRNHSVEVRRGSATLWIAGVDEAILADADLDATFDPIPPRAAILALWHEPDYAAEVAARGAFAQLSGHSHGGQVRLPFIGPLVLPAGGRRYVIGCTMVGDMPVYTARGVGVYRPPIRLGCPPEVTLITLVAHH